MFFYLSKILWFFADPGNILLIVLCLGSVLIYRRRDKFGRTLITFVFGRLRAGVPIEKA